MKAAQNGSTPEFYAGSTPSEGFSTAEAKAFEALSTERKRGMFLTVREWAAHAAEGNESRFPIAQSVLAKKHYCSQKNASKIIREFQRLGIIVLKDEAVPESKEAAKYSWTLETTLPIPADTGEDIDDSDPF